MVSFLDLLYSCSITRGRLDSLHWKLSHGRKFEVKSFYKELTQVDQFPFPWKSIGKVKVPTRVAFFTWIAALGKILTIDNLRKRKVLILDWCCMCKSGGESVNHLLLHCPITRDLWDMVFTLFGVCWVMPKGVEDLLACWAGRFGKGEAASIGKIIPHCLMWNIWCERNARTFTGVEATVPALKFSFFQTLFEWSTTFSIAHSNTMSDTLDLCSFHT